MNSTIRICSRCETPIEAEDLRCSICGQATPVQNQNLSNQQQLVVQVLRCTGCGAALSYDPARQAPSCSFCGSVLKVEAVADPMEQTEGFLPFTVTREDAALALKNWLGSLGWFRPADLKHSARLQELKPLWWVAWVFDAESLVSWAADSNAGSRRSAWAPHSGQTRIRFSSILVSASRGLSVAEVEAISHGMNLGTVGPDPEGAEQATVEQFDLQRSQARQQVTAAVERLAAERVREHQIPGSRFRNLNVSVVLRELITRRLSLPAYVLAYRYKDSLYRVVICGQDGRLVVGRAPYSMAKILVIAALGLAVIMLVLGLIALTQ